MGDVLRPVDELFIQGHSKPPHAAQSMPPPVSESPRVLTAVNPRHSLVSATHTPPSTIARPPSEDEETANTRVFPLRPDSLEIFRPPSFLDDETDTDALEAHNRRTLVYRDDGDNDVFLDEGEAVESAHAVATVASTAAPVVGNVDPVIAALAQDLVDQEAAIDRGFDGGSHLEVILEHLGREETMVVGNPSCGFPAFLAEVQRVLELDARAGTMLHYEDAVGDIVEIVDVSPYSALRDALDVARSAGQVVVTVMQTRREVVDATARALRRRARADKLTQTKRPPSIRPGSSSSERSSRPSSIASILHEDEFPITRVAQQLGLEYVDGSRPVNITTPMDIALAANGGPRGMGTQTVASLLLGRHIQQGDDPQYAEEYASDKVKGGCAKCQRRFRFAIESAEPDETHTAVVRCPACDTINLFVVV